MGGFLNAFAVVPSGPTYTDFRAHIATLAIDGAKAWGTSASAVAGAYRMTMGPGEGYLYGTSWESYFTNDSTDSRAIQHGFPTAGAYSTASAAGYEVFYRFTSAGTQAPFYSVDRNFFASSPYSGGFAALYCDLIIYWDGTRAWWANPQAGTGPFPYTW